MKFYVLAYDRLLSRILNLSAFDGSMEALDCRMNLEHKTSGNDQVEVVILSAPSEESLRSTHGRYFRSSREILSSAASLKVA